jgi:hypothetical protein
MTDQDNNRSDFIAALRKIALVLEANPDLRIPYFGTQVIRCESVDEIRSNVLAYGGHWTKNSTDSEYEMVCRLHNNLSLMIYASHEKVCERVVVGVKHVPETVVPAEPEKVIPARDEELVKWICPSVMAEVTTCTEAVDAVESARRMGESGVI